MNVDNVKFEDICDKNTQERFTWAVTLLALGETGKGLNPNKLETAMEYCREWKCNLVKFLIGKPIKGEPAKTHTKETATQTADAIFKFRYEQEIRAFESSAIQPYWTRNELSNIEFGRNLFEDARRLDEVDTDIYKLPRAWTSAKQQKLNYGQLLSYLVQGKSGSIVLRNAKAMARNFAITWEQYNSLRTHAGELPSVLRTHVREESVTAA